MRFIVRFKIFGLDWFDVVVHLAVTIALAVAVDSLVPTRYEDLTMGFLFAGSLMVLGYRRRRALAAAPEPAAQSAIEALEERVAELEAQQGRLLELEERLDFAERVLTQQRERDAIRLPAGQEMRE